MGENKRGVSPVIASVMLVMLVLVLASIIFLWAKGFVNEQIEKFGEPIEKYCDRVDFSAELYDNTKLQVLNKGDVDIHSFSLKKIRDGDSEMSSVALAVDAGLSGAGAVSVEMENGEPAKEIVLYPVLIGNLRGESRNNVFTCVDEGVNLL